MDKTVTCPDCKIILAIYTEITVSSIALELSTSKIKLTSDQGVINRSGVILVCPDCGRTVDIDLRKIISDLYFYCDWCHDVFPTAEMIDMGQAVICKTCNESLAKRMSILADEAVT